MHDTGVNMGTLASHRIGLVLRDVLGGEHGRGACLEQALHGVADRRGAARRALGAAPDAQREAELDGSGREAQGDGNVGAYQ